MLTLGLTAILNTLNGLGLNLESLGNLIAPLGFFIFFPWLLVLGLGAWFLFRGRGD